MPNILQRSLGLFAASAVLSLGSFSARPLYAQELAAISSSNEWVNLPDAPSYQQQQAPAQSPTPQAPATASSNGNPPQQTKRIAGIMPNFNAVSADTKLPPQTPKEKFVIAAKNSFDYSSFVLSGIQAGINMATNSYPEFGHGAEGYGKY